MTTSRKILLIDDSETVREVVEDQLEAAGYDVIACDSAPVFLRTLKQEKLALVLMDVSMPVVAGDALIDIAVRNHLGRCPIVLYSDRPDAELAALASRCGAQGFISKRTRGSELVAAVARFVALPAPAAR